MLPRVAAAGSFQTGFLPLLVRRTDPRPATALPTLAMLWQLSCSLRTALTAPKKHVFCFGSFYIENTDINFSFAKLLFPQ